MEKILKLENIGFRYGDKPVLRQINYSFEPGKIYGIVGKSGSGKTTLLSVMSGLAEPSEGRILCRGEDLTARDKYIYRSRDIGVIFQNFNLLTKLTAAENVELSLELSLRSTDQKADPKELYSRAYGCLREVGLGQEEADRRVLKLSGGQQQRVAIARALVNQPKVLLLDEPLGALDLKLRKEMQVELKRMQQQLGITFIYVTHDQEEALTMSDTIVVMKDGVIQQIGKPTDIYNEPNNPFVADFIGESNIVPAVMLEDYKVRFKGLTFKCVDAGFGKNVEVDVVIRPEDIDIVPPEQARVVGKVVSVVFMGVHYEIDVDCGGYEWVVHSTDYAAVGDTVGISIPPDAIHVMKKTRESNIFDAEVWPSEGMIYIDNVGFAANALEGYENKEIAMVEIAPEKVQIVNPQDAKLTGTIKSCMFLGTHYQITVSCEENDWIAHSEEFMEDGEEVGILVDAQDLILTDKKE